MPTQRVVVIGAGIAGLSAAIDLSQRGFEVIVIERASTPGGKLRQVAVGGRMLDAGPTVFTLRHVFDELFDDAGDNFGSRVRLTAAGILARHAWHASTHLDLYADAARSVDAIGSFAGKKEASGYQRFLTDSRAMFETLDASFMRSSRPSVWTLIRRLQARPRDLWNIRPFTTLWRATGRYFHDLRLRQLFARYATYCGSSPFAAPATLMLIAHAEQAGVWYVDGGMFRIAEEMAALAVRSGVEFRYGGHVDQIETRAGRVCAIYSQTERIAVDAVICSADTNALAQGNFGDQVGLSTRATAPAARSLSAITWNLVARTEGFKLAHHTVFFSKDYKAEFESLVKRQQLPLSCTVYVCAQDRQDGAAPANEERLLCLINAPAIGDKHQFSTAEIEACETRTFETLRQSGLIVQHQPSATVTTTPTQFNQLFPATGGSLYGPALHSPTAAFSRATSRSSIPGLYLAGGSTHPGPGIPMAALSGRLAAACITKDFASTVRSSPMAIRGGISTA